MRFPDLIGSLVESFKHFHPDASYRNEREEGSGLWAMQ